MGFVFLGGGFFFFFFFYFNNYRLERRLYVKLKD